MKRIILILILFFNLLPCIKHGEIKWTGEIEAMAQSETPGGAEDVPWSCSASDIVNSESECTFTVTCSCTIKGASVTATYGVSHSVVYGNQTTSHSGGGPDDPPESYQFSCTCDTSTKSVTPPPVVDPPITPPVVSPPVEPPADPPSNPTIIIGGGSGTPTMVTCPSVTLSSTIPTSATATDGTITPSVSGGSGSYDISISSGTPLTDGKFSGLGIGHFEVTVTDKTYSCQDAKASVDLALPCPSTKTQETENLKSATCPSDSSSSVYEVTKDCNGNQTGRKFLSVKCKCPDDNDFQVTAAMLKEINSSGYQTNMDSSAHYLNQYMETYGINTRLRLAYFLANASEETENFRKFIEDTTQYTANNLLDLWPDLFDSSNVNQYAHCTSALDRAYADDGNKSKHNNGNEASKDGSTFRGRGLFHLTHRDSYYRFTKYYQQLYNDQNTDFESNPNLLRTNYKYAVLSALWEYGIDKSKDKYGNDLPLEKNALLNADNDNIKRITKIINGGTNGLDIRKAKLKLAKKQLCLN